MDTEAKVQKHREWAADEIKKYVDGTLALCSTVDEICIACMFFGMWAGQVLRGVSPDQLERIVKALKEDQ